MPTKWNPRSKPPSQAREFLEWLAGDLALFQETRADFPNGRLTARARNKLVREWQRAREAAELEDAEKVGPDYYAAVKRFQRTRTIFFPAPKRRTRGKSAS